MEFFALALFGVGIVVGVVGFFRIVLAGFRVNALWGLACLVPVVAILFAITHREHASGPLRNFLFGVGIWFAGAIVTGMLRGQIH
jgi:hypothetical protein